MTFTGKEKHIIPAADARQFIENFREEASTGTIYGGFFGKHSILALLGQADCVGIRFYYGKDSNSQDQLVLVGVKPDGSEHVNGYIASLPIPCPPECGNTPTLFID